MSQSYDCIIIGAGVCGTAAARELSRYTASLLVLEREEDLCCGTSKANSAIVHAGYDAKPGSLKAKLNVLGARAMKALSEELDFPYKQTGSLVLAFDEAGVSRLEALLEQGRQNGVEGLEILTADRVWAMEPHVSKECLAALYAPTAAIVCPFGLTYALGENAVQNGAEFRFDTQVTGFQKSDGLWQVETDHGIFTAKTVVNAAGVYADVLHNLVSGRKLQITPRKGEYLLLDKEAGAHISGTIFQVPGPLGKGVLVTPTVHGNLLLGPTALDIFDRDGTDTTAQGLVDAAEKAKRSVENLPLHLQITSFAGLRAHEAGGEFVIGEVEDAPGFFDCAGIESPGLSSAPAIGQMLAEAIAKKLDISLRKDFMSTRKGILDPRRLSFEQRKALIASNPNYGRIICRCEEISQGEILDAIHRPLGAKSLDGVKRRVRAGMGRCQGGFCAPKVMELLAEDGVPWTEQTKSGPGSQLLTGRTKGGL